MEWSVLEGYVEKVAPLLIGAVLERTNGGEIMKARIVEVEAFLLAKQQTMRYSEHSTFRPAGRIF